jgi:DNA-binding protein HU-beta
LNRTELAQQVASRAGIDSNQAKKAVDAVVDSITEELSRGGEVSLSGFGKFSVSDRAARQGVNPATGEKIQIKASKAAKFSSASGLKSTLNPS